MTLQELISIFRHKYNLSLNDIAESIGGKIYLKYHFFKPIVGVVKAGYDSFANQDIEGYEEVSKNDYDRGDYYLRVKGDSMIGSRIYEGDLILVQKTSDVQSGELGVVMINGDEATVKRIIKKESMLILEASNPKVETRYFTADEVENLPVRIIGKVINVKMNIS